MIAKTKQFTKDEITQSHRIFKTRRDDLLHEDEATMTHHLDRFVHFCESDALVKSILDPLLERYGESDASAWWNQFQDYNDNPSFPTNADEELALRFRILQQVVENPRLHSQISRAMRKYKADESVQLFRTLVIRPFANEVTHRLGKLADLATPEEIALQAVPIKRFVSPSQSKIFCNYTGES